MKITRDQVNRWNAKLANGFRLDIERCVCWNDKVAVKTVELPNGNFIKAEIGYHEVYDEARMGCYHRSVLGVRPCLTLSLWKPSGTAGMYTSQGMGAKVEFTEALYTKRVWNELAKFTAGWDDASILAEAKKHLAGLRNEFVA